MTVTIGNPRDGAADILTVENMGLNAVAQPLAAYPRILASYANGVLTLTGPDETANFQSVLRTLTYDDTASSPDLAPRVITVVASDPAADSQPVTTRLIFTTATDPFSAKLASLLSGTALTDYALGSVEDWLQP